ncbi:hypothetical protein TELCIR_04821 [Teladorsagia circumcincta]|uniref:RRM domain-containing protein n=1 Tax=Teladorsagia circumcincta TaxID=45464 RepID=A0A2G9USK2_TELCI|nr:hypothetical protein TELCIR_04821 [Teladorsagia circumcincta]
MFAVLKDGSYVPKREPSPIPEEVVKERVAKREEVRKKEREVAEPKIRCRVLQPSRESARSSDHNDDRRKPIPEKVPRKEDLPPPTRSERPPQNQDVVHAQDHLVIAGEGLEHGVLPTSVSEGIEKGPDLKAEGEVDPPNVEIVGLRVVTTAERGDVVITTGDHCVFDHGPDPVVVDDSALEKMVKIPEKPASHNFTIPPPGYHPPNPPPPGVEPIFTGPPPAPRPVEGYNPEAPSLSGPDFSMPPPPLPVPINTAPWRPSPYAVPTTANVVVPTIGYDPSGGVPVDPSSAAAVPRQPIMRGGMRGRGRGGPATGRFPQVSSNRGDGKTLQVKKIPPELNNIAKLNEHFATFGSIVNMQREVRETVRDGREPLREPRRRSRSRSPRDRRGRGDHCVFDHGPDPVVVDDSALEKMVKIPEKPASHNFTIPPPGYHPPNPPPPGVEPIFTGPPPAPRPVEGYNPEAPSLSGPDFSMPPPPLPVPINTAPWRPSPYAVPTTANVVVPTIGYDPSGGVPVDPSSAAAVPRQPIMRGGMRGRGRGGPATGRFPQVSSNRGDGKTLQVKKIPPELNNIAKLNEHFATFGSIVNMQMATIENSKFVNQELKETREKIIEAKRKLKAEKIHDLSAKLKSCTESIAELEKVIASETTSHKEKSSNSDGRDSASPSSPTQEGKVAVVPTQNLLKRKAEDGGDVDAKRVSTVIAVRRVKPDDTEALVEHMSQYGNILNVEVVRGKDPMVLLTFRTKEDADQAVMDGGLFKGAMLDVTWHRRSGGSGENSPLSADKMLASIPQSESDDEA